MAILQAYGVPGAAQLAGRPDRDVRPASFETLTQIATLTAGRDRPDVDRRAHHRAGHRQRHQLHHLRRHRQPRAGRAQRLPASTRTSTLLIALRGRRHRRGRGDHLHPGRPAPDPDPVRQPRPRPADVFGRPDVPAAAGQPGRRHPDHLRGQHPAVPAAAGVVLLDLGDPDREEHRRGRRRRSSTRARRSTSSCTSS